MKQLDKFFALARERYQVLLNRRAGKPWPWTEDPILQRYKFCNVFREDDRTTTWFRENIRKPLDGDERVYVATIAFRWFNRIETGEKIKDVLLEGWDGDEVERRLQGVAPLVTGAYMVKSPFKQKKLPGLRWCIDQIAADAPRLLANWNYGVTLEGTWEVLRRYPFSGHFIAYEFVTDLRHTHLLRDAPDIMSWASPGPGACRGHQRIKGEKVWSHAYTRDFGRDPVIKGMRAILEASKDASNWPASWPQWEMRDVEHMLCEFDKYERVRLNEGLPKQRYRFKEIPCTL